MKEIPAQSILIIGGSGVFGSRIAEGLVTDGVEVVVIVERSTGRLRETASRNRNDWMSLNRDVPDLEEVLRSLQPFVVIDSAGPFQTYESSGRYRLVRAAMTAGALPRSLRRRCVHGRDRRAERAGATVWPVSHLECLERPRHFGCGGSCAVAGSQADRHD